jgi:hypothetical protein
VFSLSQILKALSIKRLPVHSSHEWRETIDWQGVKIVLRRGKKEL